MRQVFMNPVTAPLAALMPRLIVQPWNKNWMHFPMLVAVSGGPDSVALLRLLLHLRAQQPTSISVPIVPNDCLVKGSLININQPRASIPSLSVGHVNHGLRGPEADADEAFVRDLCDQLGVACHVWNAAQQGSAPAQSARCSEEQLRDLRYQALLNMAHETGARYLAMGHSRDDQVETILFRIFRGTGLAGLAGIPSMRVIDDSVTLIRPVLDVSRAEILELLDSLQQTYCVDASNRNQKYARNYLRQTLIPLLKDAVGSHVDESLLRLGNHAQEVQQFITQQAENLKTCLIQQTSSQLELDTDQLAAQHQLLIRQFLVGCWQEQEWPIGEMTFEHWTQLVDIVQRRTPQTVINLPGNIRVDARACHVVISSPKSEWENLPDQ